MSPSPEVEPGLTERPAIPRPLALLLVAIIALASGSALVWPSLPFNAPTVLAGPSAVGLITNDIEVQGGGGRVGSLAPDFRWIDSSGAARTLTGLRGRTVVLNFWATWCVPCREEMPALERAAVMHPEVTFLEIDLQEDGAKVRAFFDSLGLAHLEPLLDPNGSVTRRYSVMSVPNTFFVDRDGVIAHLEIGGPMSDATIARGLDAAARR